MLDMMKKQFSLRLAAVAVGCMSLLCACSGGGSDSSSDSVAAEGGFAPASLTGDIRLDPKDAQAHGYIILTNTPARVAYFGSDRQGTPKDGNPQHPFIGNYTYKKCGPNMAHLKLDNVRYDAIDSAQDCHWTIAGDLTFVDANTIVFTGTETLQDNGAGNHTDKQNPANDDKGADDSSEDNNDPLGFGGSNHVVGTEHDGGGSRNFSLNYAFKMGN